MKTLILAIFLVSSPVFSAVVKSHDNKNDCDLYRATVPVDGKPTPVSAGEVVVLNREVYGLSINEMEVDFDNREVSVNVMMNIVLGIDKPLLKSRAAIIENNPNFKMLVNQLNRKIYLLERICISRDQKIVYGKPFETDTLKN